MRPMTDVCAPGGANAHIKYVRQLRKAWSWTMEPNGRLRAYGRLSCHNGRNNRETDDNPKGGKEKLPRIVRGTALIVRGLETVGISAGRVPHVEKF